MTEARQLLDCTLRDGGYYTDWEFDPGFATRYLDTVAEQEISDVEIGYLYQNSASFLGRYSFVDYRLLEEAKARLRPDQRVWVMVNEKETDAARIEKLLRPMVGVLDGVRFATRPDHIADIGESVSAVRSLGVRTAANVMYLHRWVHDPSQVLADLPPSVDVLNLVDSYGACYPEQISRCVRAICDAADFEVGFHGHDNLRLAVANALSAHDAGASCADATLTGMGRGAGNAQTETLLLHRQGERPKRTASLLRLLDELEAWRSSAGWGASYPYGLAATAGVPQGAIMDLLSVRRYDSSLIADAAGDDVRVDSVEYPNYQISAGDGGDSVIIVGGGDSVRRNVHRIVDVARRTKRQLVLVSLRHAELLMAANAEFDVCLVGVEASRRWQPELGSFVRTVVVPEPPRHANSTPDSLDRPIRQQRVTNGPRHQIGEIEDAAPLSLALQACMDSGVEALVVGFDGYDDKSDARSRETAEAFASFRRAGMQVRSATPTTYDLDIEPLYGL